MIDAEEREWLMDEFEMLSPEERLEGLWRYAVAIDEAEDYIAQLEEDIAVLDKAVISFPQSAELCDELLHGPIEILPPNVIPLRPWQPDTK